MATEHVDQDKQPEQFIGAKQNVNKGDSALHVETFAENQTSWMAR